MNLDSYTTPETDAVCNQVPVGCLPAVWNYDKAINHARDLERRLALCRDGLRAAMNLLESLGGDDGLSESGVEQYRTTKEALTLTAPK